ncbi:MAG: inositol monophosphatase [Chloroflexota bacterium]|nr:inositol monophosphatase [Chloroflexota bacterium]
MQEEEVIIAACHAAQAGGAILRSYFGQPLTVQEKQGADIVTEADLAAEKTICAVLRAFHPHFSIFSEEQGLLGEETEYTWVVDPLDGTNNFVGGIPQFGVSIALTHRQETLLGVVYQPMTDTLWRAYHGKGAWRNNTVLTCNATSDLQRAVIASIQGYLALADLSKAVQQVLQDRVKRVVTNWAPSLDWCLLAEGRIAALVSLDSEREDQLAGTCIAQEAGVLVTDLTGSPYHSSMPRLLAAGHPVLHETLRQLLLDTIP